MQIRENIPISELTTMRLGGKARFVAVATSPEDIREAYLYAQERQLPVWAMGGGANTIGHDEGFPGVIILNRIRGIYITHGREKIPINTNHETTSDNQGGQVFTIHPDPLTLTGMSGEVWDDFVRTACELGYSGIEAMSLIPGTLGAAPVQNIGAYGQDISQTIHSVEAYDTREDKFVTLAKDEMDLAYRHTRFNHGADAGRFIIASVTVQLHKTQLEPPFYNSLQKYIDEHQITDFSPLNIRRMVCEIRNSKLPDPEKIASAGSFFKNIYLNPTETDQAEAKGIPLWRSDDGSGKVNSGWLVEQCGFKGKNLYGFHVSEQAALVLINDSATTYAQLDRARSEIIETVRTKFGYTLEQEPVEIPVDQPSEKLAPTHADSASQKPTHTNSESQPSNSSEGTL